MPAYYSSDLVAFLQEDASAILWRLAQANAAARFPLTAEAIEAWNAQIPVLKTGVSELLRRWQDAKAWTILLEYPIPFVGKRIDVVLLAHNAIIVIEIKTGTSTTSAIRQVDDYAVNLACFHEPSARKRIVPLVVTNAPVSAHDDLTLFNNLIENCRLSSTLALGITLDNICREYVVCNEPQIGAQDWNEGRFRPIPPLIEAAVALYSGMNVFEIGHACAARESLEETTKTIIQTVLHARSQNKKIISFVTGVPGAGKTLVGLNTVHTPEIKDFSFFLSGNGPLVKVIQEALIRDVVRRKATTRERAQLEVRAFIHNVHRFADEYYGEGKRTPAQRVVVFDEAQRAWDKEENERSGRPCISEPEMMLEVMNRHSDWAAIVALVGNGQEINRGEAGIDEWVRAISKFPEWIVYAPPNVMGRSDGRFQDRRNVIGIPGLHLHICTRSIRAQRISEWVDYVLSGEKDLADQIAADLDCKPVVTRSLSAARAWLTSNRRGSSRSGLVGSASAVRLRADGLEPGFDFQQRFEWEHWFLDQHDCKSSECDHKYCYDVRASSKLEVAATQFKIQGLELDWVGLCWGEDLTWNGTAWVCRRFNNKQWKPVRSKDQRKISYLINGYRVLLTRARQGMVLYVPSPSKDDSSRLHKELDNTAEFLISCGASII